MLVVAVPEGLPLAVTISLAYSVKVDPPRQFSEWLANANAGTIGSLTSIIVCTLTTLETTR